MKKILSIILTAVILIGSFSIIGIAKSAPKTPDKVTGVTATAGYNTVKLRWKKSANATSYRIYRYSEVKQRYVRVTETKSTTYYVKGLSVHKTYKFYVKAANSTKSKTLVGKRSDIVTAKTKYTPSAVKNLKASTVKSSSVTLTWDKSPNVTQYRVYRYNSKTNRYEQIGKTTSNKYTVKGLKANKEYRFKVRVYLKVKEKSYLSEAAMIKVKTKQTATGMVVEDGKTYFIDEYGIKHPVDNPGEEPVTAHNNGNICSVCGKSTCCPATKSYYCTICKKTINAGVCHPKTHFEASH